MKYSPGLDGVRAIAAILVVFFHARVPGFQGGYVGVDVFFVLSGYLITRLLRYEHENTGGIDYRRFLLRRFRRLYPALLLFLAVYLALAHLVSPDYRHHWQDAILSALYLSDYAHVLGFPLGVLSHTWTLAVEEQFYLLWPLAFILLARGTAKRATLAIIPAYVLMTLWRWANIHHMDRPWEVYSRFDTHCTGLLLGCALGYNHVTLHRIWSLVGAAGLVACLATLQFGSPASAAWGFTFAEISAALLVVGNPIWLGGTILPWIGRMSYGLYLWHYLFVRMVRDHYWWGWGWYESALLGLTAGLACAACSHYLVERRFHHSLVERRAAPKLLAPR